MKTANTYPRKASNAALILILYLGLGVYSCVGQSFQRFTYSAIEGTFGYHGFKNITRGPKDLVVLSRGVGFGVVAGNNLVKARIRPLGIYNSTGTEKRAFQIIESEMLINLHPLEFWRSSKHVLDIYITSGISYNSFRYKDRTFVQDDDQFRSISKVTCFNQVTGIGVEYLVLPFAQVFTEAMFKNAIYISTDNCTFLETFKEASTKFRFGVRFTRNKQVKTHARFK